MKKLLLIILSLLIVGVVYASNGQVTPVADLNSQNTSVVNNNFQGVQTGLNGIFGLFSAYFTNGFLNTNSGGTGVSSVNWSANSLVYMPSKGVWGNIGIGTTGQVLTVAGSPTWATPAAPALILKSTTTVSSAGSTGNITLVDGKTYLIVVKGTVNTNGDNLFLQFNADAGGNYNYNVAGLITGATSIHLTSTGLANGVGFAINMTMLSNADSVNFKDLISDTIFSNGGGSAPGTIMQRSFGGYLGVAPITSFRIFASTGTINATVWVYEYSGT